jgi:ABC-type dipeptide/oligopeptide/nickel transport system permease component
MNYFLKRVAAAAFVVLGTVTLVFLILHWLPGDPASLMAGENAPPAQVARVRAELGTDRPLIEQYAGYMGKLACGDLGKSYATGESVRLRLGGQISATLGLTFFAALVAITVGISLGVLAAVHRGGWLDHLVETTTLTFSSMPSFWLGILLMLIFSVHFHWLPSIGNGSWAQLVLPVTCMGLSASGMLTRMVRNSVLDVLDAPFVVTLRAGGLLEHSVLYRHVLRSALMPAITILGVVVGELLAGTVVVETLFARQGVGRLIAEAVAIKDVPMLQGAVLFTAIIFVLISLLVDLSYGWIDRRARL